MLSTSFKKTSCSFAENEIFEKSKVARGKMAGML